MGEVGGRQVAVLNRVVEGPQVRLKAYRGSWRGDPCDSLQEECPGQREQPVQRPCDGLCRAFLGEASVPRRARQLSKEVLERMEQGGDRPLQMACSCL